MVRITPLEKADEMTSPRRIKKYILAFCAHGNATIVVDDSVFEIKPDSLITITSGQVHHLKRTQSAKGYVLEFTYDFFCKTDEDIELIFHNSLFCHFAMNEVIQLSKNNAIAKLLKQIENELLDKPYQYLISIHSLIELILVEINRAKISQGGEIYKPDALFLKFLECIRNNFKTRLSVGEIATMISTTESKLNELSKLHTGRTALSVVHGLVISEAKRLLTYEKLSVKETAFRLGFDDPFYFSNFFKQRTKISPNKYKKQIA